MQHSGYPIPLPEIISVFDSILSSLGSDEPELYVHRNIQKREEKVSESLYIKNSVNGVRLVVRDVQYGYDILNNPRSSRVQFVICMSEAPESTECAICMLDLFDSDMSASNNEADHAIVCYPANYSCGHLFHSVCLLEAFTDSENGKCRGKVNCPICRYGPRGANYFETYVHKEIRSSMHSHNLTNICHRVCIQRKEGVMRLLSHRLKLMVSTHCLAEVVRAEISLTPLQPKISISVVAGFAFAVEPLLLCEESLSMVDASRTILARKAIAIAVSSSTLGLVAQPTSAVQDETTRKLVERISIGMHTSECLHPDNARYDPDFITTNENITMDSIPSLTIAVFQVPFGAAVSDDGEPESTDRQVQAVQMLEGELVYDGTGYRLDHLQHEQFLALVDALNLRHDHVPYLVVEMTVASKVIGFTVIAAPNILRLTSYAFSIIGQRPNTLHESYIGSLSGILQCDMDQSLIRVILPMEINEILNIPPFIRTVSHLCGRPARQMPTWEDLVPPSLCLACLQGDTLAWQTARLLVIASGMRELAEVALPPSVASHIAFAVTLFYYLADDIKSSLIPIVDVSKMDTYVRRLLRDCFRFGDVHTLKMIVQYTSYQKDKVDFIQQKSELSDVIREIMLKQVSILFAVCYGRKPQHILQVMIDSHNVSNDTVNSLYIPDNPFHFKNNGVWLAHLCIQRGLCGTVLLLFRNELANIIDRDEDLMTSTIFCIVQNIEDTIAKDLLENLYLICCYQSKLPEFLEACNQLCLGEIKIPTSNSVSSDSVFETALLLSIRLHKPICKRWLIRHGADSNIKTSNGQDTKNYEREYVYDDSLSEITLVSFLE